MDNELTELARATQEVAKTTRTGIEAAHAAGSFLARVLGEPLETAVGIVTDRLKLARAERLIRLRERYEKALKARSLAPEAQPVPPRIALPAMESASLEENNELQDLWANLLASGHDPNLNGVMRAAFVDILKQLEVVDVHLLDFVFDKTMRKNVDFEGQRAPQEKRDRLVKPVKYAIRSHDIMRELGIDTHAYECSIDNLMRMRCLAPNLEDVEIVGGRYPETATRVQEYDWVTITSLGWDFVRACNRQEKPA